MEHNVANCNYCTTGKSEFKFCSGNCDLTVELALEKLKNREIQFLNNNHNIDMFCSLSNSSQNLYNYYYTGTNEYSSVPFDNLPIINLSDIL